MWYVYFAFWLVLVIAMAVDAYRPNTIAKAIGIMSAVGVLGQTVWIVSVGGLKEFYFWWS